MLDAYRFGSAEVRPAERSLLVDGTPAALGARAFDLLVALIERRDRVVMKSELFDAVWPGLVVEENNLQVQVSSLRKLLGSSAIATVPGRGYRFVAPLDANGAGGASACVEACMPPTNLPHARTRFIGRETALADCSRLLRDTRLLTLSGIGGCGKTRLAQELAQRELSAFPDGVWFVDLGPLQEAQRVSATVAATLGVQVGQLTDHLKTRCALVVMDNCEHVIEAVTRSIETLLEACGAVKIVATSREVLGTAGEQVFAVRSLSLPATAAVEDVRRSEAVRLFVDHARLAVPDFDVDERNAAAVAEICRRLDGIALAIELAAARVRVLGVEDIRARLDDRFRLLTGGNRALPRHETLQATMQWSHDHLTAPEQVLLRRLAVFAGGCTLAAAAEVAGDGADEYEVLERLTALHDKSLLLVDRDTQAQPRYRMLETVRQYAAQRLDEASEGDEIRARHLGHFVALAERLMPDMRGRGQAQWQATFRLEQENLAAAYAFSAHAPQGGELALRLTRASWRFWVFSSQPERGYRFASGALALAGDAGDTPERSMTLYALSNFAYRMGRYEEATSIAERCLAMALRIGAADLVTDGYVILASAQSATGMDERALELYARACDLARAAGDDRRLDLAQNGIAEIHRGRGNFTAAEPIYRESILRTRSAQNWQGTAVTLLNLACLLVANGKLDEARDALRESRALTKRIGATGLVECATDVVAALASVLGDHETAARFNGAMLRQMQEAGICHDPVDEGFIAPRIAASRRALGAHAFDAAQRQGWALNYEAAVGELDQWLARAPTAAST